MAPRASRRSARTLKTTSASWTSRGGELARLKAEAVTKGEEAFAAPAVAQAIAHGFHTHAERFDALYAEHIPQSAV